MPAAAAIAMVAVAAGSAGYNAYESSQSLDAAQNEKSRQEKLAEKAANDAKAAQDKQTAEMTAAQTQADTRDQQNALRIAQQRRRTTYGQGTMKGGTLITGPQGLSTPATTATKTLLGS